MRVRQQDVKQTWRVLLNDAELGRLKNDENDMVIYFSVPPGALRRGENRLRIEQDLSRRPTPDDVRVGEIVLDSRDKADVLGEASVRVTVLDADSGKALPSRITVLNEAGALQTPGATSNDHLAVRPGTIYTSSGHARFGLPPGNYTVYAGRGFEYSLAKKTISVTAGESAELT
ncbi:MAG: carboxypeptidase regulatory-like domain-containing protein, partial [bacterium]|nr:carboxypeptidase regulatory-like domain-containing protein [bacterium]